MSETTNSIDPIRTVLVATDFSETAGLALTRGAAIARAHSARLALVHGFELAPLLIAGPGLMALPTDYESQVRDASRQTLEELAEGVRQTGLEVTTRFCIGAGGISIIESAQQEHADLIVTGARGLTTFARIVLGSTAKHIVRHAECPVLTVHPDDPDPAEPGATVIVPTDFSEDAERAVGALERLFAGRESDTRLVLVHAYQSPVALTPLAGTYPAASVLAADAGKLAHEALDPAAERLRGAGYRVEVAGREGDAATVVTTLAEREGASLIAMGTRGLSGLKHLLLGSVAERVVQHASCPVLTVGPGPGH